MENKVEAAIEDSIMRDRIPHIEDATPDVIEDLKGEAQTNIAHPLIREHRTIRQK